MSVLIKDIDIPESCSDCPLNHDDMSCVVTGTRWWSDTMVLMNFDYTKERLYDCPLSEVQSAQPSSSCVHENDSISRQAAIELVKDVCDAIMSGCNSHYDSEVGDEVYDDILEVDAILTCNKEIRKALKGMPSAQPKRKKGAWINGGRIIRCNRCKIGYATVKGMKNALTYNFCPSCGADMRGEQDETD